MRPTLSDKRLALVLALATGACRTPATLGDDTDGPASETSDTPPEETGDEPEATGFVPDWGSASECDVWQQDCPDEGDKCVPYASSGYSWDAHKCVPVIGSQATGEPCSYAGAAEATDDCDATGVCWNVQEVDGELLGECAPFCTGTADQPICPPGYLCPLSGDATITVCDKACDPLAQACQAGTACFWAGSDFRCIDTTQDIPAGQPCAFINDCAGGLICLTADVVPDCAGLSCCTPYCELGLGDGPCEVVPGSVCAPVFLDGEAPPEHTDVGVCRLP